MINGTHTPTFFSGIVEENDDPMGYGRVRVRIFGVHPPYASTRVMTEDLPWATCINGTYGAMHRVPDIGEWVMGMSIDGLDYQNLILLGVIPGMTRGSVAGSTNGANSYSKPHEDAIRKVGNPVLPPQMSGEDLEHTPLLAQMGSRVSGIKTPDGHSVEEPLPVSGAGVARKTVWNSSYNGSYIEIDDDENAGFIAINHATGAGVQIDNNGTIRLRSTGDTLQVSDKTSAIYTYGRRDIVIENGAYTISVNNGDMHIACAGDIHISSNGGLNLSSAKKTTINAGEGVEIRGATVAIEAVADNISMQSPNMILLRADEEIAETTARKVSTVQGDYEIVANGDMIFETGSFSAYGGGEAALDFSKIHLNSGKAKEGIGSEGRIVTIDLPEPPVVKTKTAVIVHASPQPNSVIDVDDDKEETS